MVTQVALSNLAERASKMRDAEAREETVKHALVLPFISALGYDVFDPTDVAPEFTADFGLKRGEKVDYAILSAGEPIIIIECKAQSDSLSIGSSQLARYFSHTSVTVGTLTNGTKYKFFSDLEADNLMDTEPFEEIDLLNPSTDALRLLELLTKDTFNADRLRTHAEERRYTSGIKSYLQQLLYQPDEAFVRLLLGKVYSGRLTSGKLEHFKPLVRSAFQSLIAGQLSNTHTPISQPDPEPTKSDIVTTEEEVEAFELIQIICIDVIDRDRIIMRDRPEHCLITIDDNQRKRLARLFFNNTSDLTFLLTNEFGEETEYRLAKVADLLLYRDDLITQARFLANAKISNRNFYLKRPVATEEGV